MNNEYKKQFEVCVRAVIKSRGKILVCWHKEKKYYFFPGGHIDFGETAESALIRELKEELDIVVRKLSFIGMIENIYIEKRDKHKEHRGKHHELNLIFSVSAKKVKDKSLEDHIDFVFLDNKKFKKEKVLPLILQKNVIKWLEDKKIFWASQI
jgi:8-oxo-dGTP pyrophosphatase MutT (NUDIX family)